MEIKRKLMTDEQIAQTERTLMDEVTAVRDEYADKFAFIGYELALEFSSKDDTDDDYSKLDTENVGFPCGYVSRATITVKRPKTAEDEKEDEELVQEDIEEAEELGAKIDADEEPAEEKPLTDEEQQALDEKTLKESEDDLRRSVAFTHVMLIRIYRSFWIDSVSVCDGMEQLRADLDEFYTQLSEEAVK